MDEVTAAMTPAPGPGTRTQEMRIAELEAALGKAQAANTEKGALVKGLEFIFGTSWQTTLAGLAAGAVALAPILPSDMPTWVHKVSAIAMALSLAYLGRTAKATTVTGVAK